MTQDFRSGRASNSDCKTCRCTSWLLLCSSSKAQDANAAYAGLDVNSAQKAHLLTDTPAAKWRMQASFTCLICRCCRSTGSTIWRSRAEAQLMSCPDSLRTTPPYRSLTAISSAGHLHWSSPSRNCCLPSQILASTQPSPSNQPAA